MASTTSKNKSSDGQGFGVFTRGEQEVTAWSAEEAVRYRFEGWQETQPAAAENREGQELSDQA